ncbi:MAG TPA: hypothetical protein VML19_16010 [Verrucomicrobiae bacterium]|nr:hypothetical protein [Verrucomicrobiae bacterium]
MTQTVSMIGISAAELRWIRTLVQLLRHPDPSVPELTRQALVYMTDAAARTSLDRSPADRTPLSRPRVDTLDFAG